MVHKGRPGAEHAGAGKFGVFGGLTCILAENFDRASLFSALKSRHCYGTSGPRIALHAEMEGKSMGSDLSHNSESVSFSVNVIGTAPIERIDLLKAGQCIDSWEGCPYEERSGNSIRIRWTGARILNRNRATDWNGLIKDYRKSVIERRRNLLLILPPRGFRNGTRKALDGKVSQQGMKMA